MPKQWENTYFAWMRDLKDWCISRQLWWGHRIPAFYDDQGQIYVGANEDAVRLKYRLPASMTLRQDDDVLDTWFSSALWTFSTLGWPDETPELARYNPHQCVGDRLRYHFFLGGQNDHDDPEIHRRSAL